MASDPTILVTFALFDRGLWPRIAKLVEKHITGRLPFVQELRVGFATPILLVRRLLPRMVDDYPE